MYSSVVVYVPYGVYVQIRVSASFLRYPKGSGPGRSCDVGCGVSHPSCVRNLNVSNHIEITLIHVVLTLAISHLSVILTLAIT